MKHIQPKTSAACILLTLWTGIAAAAPLGTAFTYQGRLTDSGVGPNGTYELRLAAWDALNAGSQVAIVTNTGVLVSNGLFTTTVDFGAGGFNGTAYWLEVGVRTNGSASAFTTLTPRQPLTPSPYALYASVAPLADGSVTSAKIADGSVTSAKIQDGTIATVDLANNAVTSAKVLDGTLVGADLANNTIGSDQL